jgi:hypothetical protein
MTENSLKRCRACFLDLNKTRDFYPTKTLVIKGRTIPTSGHMGICKRCFNRQNYLKRTIKRLGVLDRKPRVNYLAKNRLAIEVLYALNGLYTGASYPLQLQGATVPNPKGLVITERYIKLQTTAGEALLDLQLATKDLLLSTLSKYKLVLKLDLNTLLVLINHYKDAPLERS